MALTPSRASAQTLRHVNCVSLGPWLVFQCRPARRELHEQGCLMLLWHGGKNLLRTEQDLSSRVNRTIPQLARLELVQREVGDRTLGAEQGVAVEVVAVVGGARGAELEAPIVVVLAVVLVGVGVGVEVEVDVDVDADVGRRSPQTGIMLW